MSSAINLALGCFLMGSFSVVSVRSQDTTDNPKFTESKDNYMVTGWTTEAEIESQLSVKYRLFEVNNHIQHPKEITIPKGHIFPPCSECKTRV